MYGMRGIFDAQPAVAPGGEAAINCTGLPGYLDPFCWSIWQGVVYGDKYKAPPMPPTVGSTLPGGVPIPSVPPVGESPQITAVNAGQIVQSITDQQIADWQAANQTFFEDLNPEVNPPSQGPNWLLWGGVALGAVAVFSFAGGSPRRYGR